VVATATAPTVVSSIHKRGRQGGAAAALGTWRQSPSR
jgi:hypothetical protein